MTSEQEQPSQSPLLSVQLDRVRQHLECSRSTLENSSRIPERLWDAAARLAGSHGLNKTARALRLDYYDLKKRLDSAARPVPVGNDRVPSFVELAPASTPALPECPVELEGPSGAKMRIHLKGTAAPDLPALISMFSGVES